MLAGLNAKAQSMWKQQVDTKIDVRLDDQNHMLHAYEELEYTNNSPDTLKYIYLHLWANAYKHDRTQFAQQRDQQGNTDFYYSKQKDRGYIDSLQFMVDGVAVEHNSAENMPDICRIDLPKELVPGGKVKITTPFKVKLPVVFSRSGHTGQAYYVSQWFPKPAVYDRKGWHPIPYLDQGEFYSEYGSYDVKVTLPANYVLLATGNCMTAEENAWMDELAHRDIPKDTLKGRFPESARDVRTVHYHEDNVHDFAWFADKRYVVRKDTVTSPGTGELVTTWSAFLAGDTVHGNKLNGYLKTAVTHYGKWVGPYPYKTIKAVFGDMKSGAGMEYPTITLLDQSAKSMLQTATIHEAGHNWFYGILGSNERDHAWMDEGMNTFYEQKTVRELSKDTILHRTKFDETLLYYEFAATHTDQAIEQPSQNFRNANYGVDIYYKSNLMLMWLEEYMGEEAFGKGMKDYYNTWHHNHPYPEDFKACMQRNTPKLIDWFFTDLLTTDKKIDYKITSAKVRQGNTVISVKNNTGVKAPALIDVYANGKLTEKIWTPPFSSTAKVILPGENWSRLKIDDVIPDGKSANDMYRRHGLFHTFGVKFNPVLGLNTVNKEKIFVAPAIGNNYYDGFMAGVLLHNLTLPENRFRFAVAPQYAFATGSFTGAGSVGYLWYPRGFVKEVMLQADAKTFHYNETSMNMTKPLYARYIKVAPSLNFTLRQRDPLSSVTRTLLLKQYNISEETFNYPADSTAKPTLNTQQKIYGLVRYKHENNRTYNPFSYSVEGHMGEDFAKINLEGNVRIDYHQKNKSLHIRAYAGKFISITNDPAVAQRYYLNASFNGMNDYLYDGTYKGRNTRSRLDAHQVSALQEGGFKIPIFNGAGRSDDWMATINLKTDLPLKKLPIRLFFDAGMVPDYSTASTNVNNRKLLYDGGVEIVISKDIASIYIPLIMSSDFRESLTAQFGKKNVFTRSISFTLNLQNINWLKTPGRLLNSAIK